MLRYAIAAATVAVMIASTPALAVSSKDKQATCKFGADSQHLQGAARAKFMKNCMANRDDPRGPAQSTMAAPK